MFARICRSGKSVLLLWALLLVQQPLAAQMGFNDAKGRAAQLCNDAVPLLTEGKYEAAESKLVESLKLDPDNSSTLSNYGMLLMKLGKLPEARKQLEKALQIDPNCDAAALNLGLACEGMGDLPTAKVNLLKFINKTQDHELAEKMKDHVRIIDKTLASGVPAVDGPDYLGQINRSQMATWPPERRPIRIFVASGEGVTGYQPGFGAAVDNAIDAWSKALEGAITFEKLKSPDKAAIELIWTHDPNTALMKAEGGECKFVMDGSGMKHANITILTVDPSASDKLNDVKVSWVALHELGHALGISGHSSNPQDVMYFAAPLKKSMPVLSARDVATYRRLYSEKLPDTWLSLNGEALKLMKAGSMEEARVKLEQAIKMEPGQKIPRENLLLVEGRISTQLLDQSKYAEAESHLTRALELEKDFQDKNLDVLLDNYALVLKNTGRSEEAKKLYQSYGKKVPKS